MCGCRRVRPAASRVVPNVSCAVVVALTVSACAAHQTASLRAEAERGVYSAEGLYDPTIVRYDNGLTLVAKQRPGIRTVSVRVDVGLGMAHYECGRQNTPHFLEHMLFAGVPGMSESAFERRMFELGAWSNARTRATDTVYELDVFSGTALEAMGLLAEMLTNAELTHDSYRKTQDVVWREGGGEPGSVERRQMLGGDLASGMRKAMAGVAPRRMQICGARYAGRNVTFGAVERAYRKHYVPQRMVWTVVGDFDRQTLLAWAKDRLGSVPPGDTDAPEAAAVTGFDEAEYAGFAPEPEVQILARTDGMTGNSYYVRRFLAHLLDQRLYTRLRLEEPLTYTPGSFSYNGPDWGVFGLSAETEAEDQDKALSAMREIIDELVDAPLPPEEFRAIQLSLLRRWAQSVETNTDYAEYYINSLPELRRDGRFINEEARIAALTPQRVHEVAKRLFAKDRTVVVRDRDIQTQITAR